MVIFALIGGIMIGFAICGSIISSLLNTGKIDSVLKFLDVKKRYAEVTISKPPKPNPDLYYNQSPDKKTPNK